MYRRFCWGGKYVVLSTTNSTNGTTRADAGVVYHGSMITLAEVKAMQKPVLFLQSDPATDPGFNTTFYAQVKEIVMAKRASGLNTNITYYPGATHGFALRGNKTQAAAAKDAFQKGAAFLSKELAPQPALQG